MSLRNVNLNLVPVLRALLREGSVSGAAASIGLSQPATSSALARLRVLLDDPLMVRVGSSMRLTPRANQIAEMLEPLCVGLEDILEEAAFDPAAAKRVFLVCAPDYVAYLLGDFLVDRISRSAPGVSVRFIEGSPAAGGATASGEFDAWITRWTDAGAQGLSCKRGYHDRMVGLVRTGHPLAGGSPAPADLGRYSQVRHQRNSLLGPGLKLWPVLEGATPVVSPHFVNSALLVVRTDSFTIVPKSLADSLEEITPVRQFELPDRGPHFEACLLWGPVNDRDRGHAWFRGLMDEGLRSLIQTTG